MLAVSRHGKGTMQLLFIKEVSSLGKLQDPIDHFGRGAVEMRNSEELGPWSRVVQAAHCCFQARWSLDPVACVIPWMSP
jgi:hypothetical protein